MGLTLVYNLRHLLARKTAAAMTIAGIAMVVAVYTATLMLAQGLKETLTATGQPDNVIVTRQGSRNEVQSGISREHANIVLTQPEVAKNPDGTPRAALECLVLVNLNKRGDGGGSSNVDLRGISPLSMPLRRPVKLVEGRLPQPGSREVMVGKPIFTKFAKTEVGSSIRLFGVDWPVVGIFEAGNTSFSSEIWTDVQVLLPAVRRDQYSSVTFGLAPGASFEAVKNRLENDRRLNVAVLREVDFYEAQSRQMSKFIFYMGTVISIVFSLGAIIGAMITMYSAVAGRTREIGVLRALGFSAGDILRAFVMECLTMALAGGIAGVVLASLLTQLSVTTTNFSSFSEVAFGFSLTIKIALQALLFSAAMGLIGGVLPAWRAARIQILSALRAE